MRHTAISTVHIHAMPGAIRVVDNALKVVIAQLQQTDESALYFLDHLPGREDTWIIHCHWLTDAAMDFHLGSHHEQLMELLSSGGIRAMAFNFFTSTNHQQLLPTGDCDG